MAEALSHPMFPDEGYSEQIAVEAFTADHVEQFIGKHRELLADPRCAVGTWEAAGKVTLYLDVTAVTKDGDLALRKAAEYNQEGVHYLLTGKTHPTRGSGKAPDPSTLPPIGERLKGIPSWLWGKNE